MTWAVLQEDAIRSCVWEFIKLGALKVHSTPHCPHITAKLLVSVQQYDTSLSSCQNPGLCAEKTVQYVMQTLQSWACLSSSTMLIELL